jgi:prolyl 4-hydroxylase
MDTERSRLKMSRDQPASQHNYTEIGFKKRKLPEQVYKILKDFYNDNQHKRKIEKWGRGYTYTNHWVAPTFMVSVEDSNLRGSGNDIKTRVWEGVRPVIEEWTGHKVKPTSMYGIRIYTDGAILATHVDRLPLVSSCIVNVAQDVREPWPIEVYDHAGKAHNVTMEPGDMVLYESHTVLHGRPAPLNGTSFANIFIHFEPLDHKEMNQRDQAIRSGKIVDMPDYEDEESEDDYSPSDYNLSEDEKKLALNYAAAAGNLGHIKELIQQDPERIHFADSNGWQPIHEAARAGHTAVVKYLVDMGADIGALTNARQTPLWWARRSLPKGHSTLSFLDGIGAPEEGEL